jgi:hypothetical protein
VSDEPTGDAPAPPERVLTPEGEASYRRASRRAVLSATLIVIVVFAAAALIGTKAIARRFEAARKLDRAQELLTSADAVVLDVDEVVRAKASPQIARRARNLGERMTVAKNDLEETVRLIDGSLSSVTDDEREAAGLKRASAEARLNMLEPARTILDASAKAGDALDPSRKGWELVVGAEKLADDSVRQYNRLNKAGVAASSKLARQAQEKLREAKPYFSQAATAFPEAGFERYSEFIDSKASLLDLSRQSNTLWLAGKIAEANVVIVRYNALEKKTIALAAGLPESPGKAVADTYERLAGAATEEYFAARKVATKADAEIEKY